MRWKVPGIGIDTHSFLGSLDGLVNEDSTPFFDLTQFENTRFIPILLNPYQNDETINSIRDHSRFLGCKLIFSPNPKIHYSPYDDVNELKRIARHPDVVGLKANPPLVDTPIEDKKFFPFYRVASDEALPLLLHCSSSGTKYNSDSMVRKICKEFPDLRLILAHFGGNNLQYMREAVNTVEEFPNLYLNTTAIDPQRVKFRMVDGKRTRSPVQETREEVFEIFSYAFSRIPGKILFGSDLGYYRPPGIINDDLEAQYLTWPTEELSEQDQRKILIDNPTKVYNKIDRLSLI